MGLDIRHVVMSIETGSAEHIYETLYCARGQAENLIKLHKAQLASDCTSCRSPLQSDAADLHTAAYCGPEYPFDLRCQVRRVVRFLENMI